MYITKLSPEVFEDMGIDLISAKIIYKKAIHLFAVNRKNTEVDVYAGSGVFRIANDLCQINGLLTNFHIFTVNDNIIGLHFKGGENMDTEKSLEEKQKDLEALVKSQGLTENLSEVAMPGVTRVLEHPQAPTQE